LDKHEAFEILGIPENSTRDEIISRYSILLKKYQHNDLTGENAELKDELDKINKAYDVVMDYTADEMDYTQTPVQKVENFFYHYKIHLFIGAFSALIIIMIIRSFLIRPNPDIDISFIGHMYALDTQTFEDEVSKAIPELEEVRVSLSTMNEKGQYLMDETVYSRVQLDLAYGGFDVCVLDRINYDRYAKLGYFKILDEYIEKYNIDMELNKANVIKTEKSDEEHLYGIDVSSNPIFDTIGGETKIIAISVNAKRPENAVKLLEYIVATTYVTADQ